MDCIKSYTQIEVYIAGEPKKNFDDMGSAEEYYVQRHNEIWHDYKIIKGANTGGIKNYQGSGYYLISTRTWKPFYTDGLSLWEIIEKLDDLRKEREHEDDWQELKNEISI